MADERPSNWDWVKATGTCNAAVVFGELKALARRDMESRNAQLDQPRFEWVEPDGANFGIGRTGQINGRVYFSLSPDVKQIMVQRQGGDVIARYSLRLDSTGVCRLEQNDQLQAHWQVLKDAFENLLFK